MKRDSRHRRLGYEQLESKALPSSLLMAVSGNAAAPEHTEFASGSVANECHFETEQILRFVAVNTSGGERMPRLATPPTAAHCAAADEMMKLAPTEWDSLIVLGYYVDGSEL